MEAKGAVISKLKSNELDRTLDIVYSGFPAFMASNNILQTFLSGPIALVCVNEGYAAPIL